MYMAILIRRWRNIPITIEVTDEILNSVTDTSGSFVYDPTKQNLRFDKCIYSVQVFVTAGGNAAEGESNTIKAEL